MTTRTDETLAAQTRTVFQRDCPRRALLDHITSRWGILLLVSLKDRALRWSELRTAADGISEKMLNQVLRTLQADGLVTRTSYPEVPPRVEYALTPIGTDLVDHLMPLVTWIAHYADTIIGSARQADHS